MKIKNKVGLIISGLIPLLIICLSMRIWEMDLKIFPSLSTDPLLYMYSIKSVQENGLVGYLFNYSTGAPGISHLADIVLNDFDTSIMGWVFTSITGNVAAAYHLTYFLTFVLAGIFMYILLRHMQVKEWIAILFSVCYSLTPYHIARQIHLVLTNIGIIPVGILFGIYIIDENYSFTKMVREKMIKRTVLFILGAMYIGFSFGYYPPFIMVILFIALLYKMIKNKTFRTLKDEAILLYLVVAFWLLAYSPKIIYGIIYGKNTVAASRAPFESEYYGLKLIQLFVPSIFNKSELFQSIAEEYNNSGVIINENTMSSLGFIGTICFIVVCTWLIYSYIRRNGTEDRIIFLDYISIATLSIFIVCTVGGIGTIISFILSPQLRCWCRGSIVIAALVLSGGAVLLNSFLDKLNKKGISCLIAIMGAVIIIWDQVPGTYESGWQNSIATEQTCYEDFFNEVEKNAANTMIYQLPYEEFYEVVPLYEEGASTAILPYLFTNTIHWSGGGAKGRDNEALNLYIDDGMSNDFVQGIIDAGFSGVYIDTYAYEDGGTEINSFYQTKLGIKPIISENRRMYYYSLTKSF